MIFTITRGLKLIVIQPDIIKYNHLSYILCHVYPVQTVTTHPSVDESTVTAREPEVTNSDKGGASSFLVAIPLTLLMVGVGYLAIEELYSMAMEYGEKLKSKPLSCRKIKKGILKAKCAKFVTHGPYVERKQLNMHLKSCLRKPTPNEEWWTKIVYGPCKSGKTVAVREVLKDQEAIVDVILTEGSVDELVTEVLHRVHPKSLQVDKVQSHRRRDALESTLINIREKYPGVVSTLLIKVTAVSQYDLSNLLEILKLWVHKRNLANTIIMLSPCPGLHPSLLCDKRAQVVSIGDLTVEETKEYLLGICDYKQLQENEEEKGQLAKELAIIAGGRLLDLQQLADDVPMGGTLRDLKTLVHKQAEYLMTRNETSLSEFLKLFEQNDKFDRVLRKLLTNERVCLDEFYKFKYVKEPKEKTLNQSNLRDDIHNIWSQPIYVNPETSEVTIRSPFMRKALEKHLSQVPSN